MNIIGTIRKLRHDKAGALLRQSWSVCWPMTLIMFFIFLIGLADVYVAGRINKDIQAAYGIASQIYFILSVAGFALTVGTVSVVAQLFTSGDKEGFVRSVNSSIIVSLIAGGLLGFVGVILARPLVYFLNIPAVLKEKVASLTQIYCLGLLGVYYLVNTNGILRASAAIKKSLLSMAVVSFLNILMNFILAFKTPLGFKGIAVATLLSTLAGCAMNLFFIRSIVCGFFRYSFAAVKKILSVGWPAGLLSVLWQLSAMALYLILANLPKDSVEVMAAFTNGLKIEAAIFLPVFAFNMANAVVVGNLLGRNNRQDAFLIAKITALLGLLITLVTTALVMFNAAYISSLLSPNQVVVQECIRYIRVALLSEPVMAWAVIIAGALNGAGDTKAVMGIVALSTWLVRVPASYVFALKLGLGPAGVWWAMNLSLAVQAFFMHRRYLQRKWLTNSLQTRPIGH